VCQSRKEVQELSPLSGIPSSGAACLPCEVDVHYKESCHSGRFEEAGNRNERAIDDSGEEVRLLRFEVDQKAKHVEDVE